MILRLDTRRPLVWRSPHSLQFGVDPRLAVLDDVSEGDARLIGALVAGVTRAGLGTLAAQAGVSAERVDEVLHAVAPALVGENASPSILGDPSPEGTRTDRGQPAPLAIVGRGGAAARVAGVLGEAGHPVAVGASLTRAHGRRPAAAVLVSSHVADPLEHQRWLRRDIAHLPIVFGEVAVTIGPLVIPGTTACLTCVELQRSADDAAWPAIASQLWGRAAATESVEHATEAAVEALRVLRTRSTGGRGEHPDEGAAGWAVRLDIESGHRTERHWSPSDQCGCRGLSSRSAPAPRRESGSGPARPAPRSAAATTTARALSARA